MEFLSDEADALKSMFNRYHQGRVYPSLTFVGSRTGRCQYNSPPINQIDKRIRDLVSVDPEKETLVGVDIVALEEMILGYTLRETFGDDTLLQNVYNGANPKQLTIDALGDLFDGFPESENYTKKDAAKRLNYAFLYGAGLTKLCNIVELSLRETTKKGCVQLCGNAFLTVND